MGPQAAIIRMSFQEAKVTELCLCVPCVSDLHLETGDVIEAGEVPWHRVVLPDALRSSLPSSCLTPVSAFYPRREPRAPMNNLLCWHCISWDVFQPICSIVLSLSLFSSHLETQIISFSNTSSLYISFFKVVR